MIGLLLLLALIPFALYRGSQVPEAEAAWWNPSWQYRQSIAVTNNTTQQTNVYISVSLDTSNTSKFQADCGDLRFTKQNGQLLPYFIASGCGTASTSVHVQLDTFPAGAQTFYAYYGNPSADNGFSSNDFLTEATNYTVGGIGSEETGPGPVAYWKFDEGTGRTAFDSANYGTGDELLLDGDMEAADTSAWTPTSNAVLSKESTNPHDGSKLLRITYGGTSRPAARQTINTPGKIYRITGYGRGDGTTSWRITTYSDVVFIGNASTNWTYFDVVYTAPQYGRVELESLATSAGYVEFDDVSVREVTSGNSGTITGATWATEDQCVSGKCLSFDGTDDYATVSDNSILEPANQLTITAWIKRNNVGTRQIFIGKGDGNSHGTSQYWLELNTSNQLDFYLSTDGVGSHVVTTDLEITDTATWHHVTGVWDGTTMNVYLDGQKSAVSTTKSGTLTSTVYNFSIGRLGTLTSFYFNGLIDEVKIFPYALSEDQIKTEYNLGAAAVMGTGPGVAPPAGGTLSDSLVAHWAFDEQYGQTAHDKVGNNHGTFGASTSPGSDDPTWKPAGECKVNGCLGFDGGDYSEIPDDNALDLTSGFTITGWLKATSLSGYKAIVSKTGSGNGYEVVTDNTRLAVKVNGAAGQVTTDPGTLTTNTWHHIAASNDGSGNVKLYIDGQLKKSGTLAIVAAGTVPLRFGMRPSGDFPFNGSLDELKIYNTALTADQVKQDMNAGASVAYSVGSEEADELADGAGAPPIAEWKFDEKQGTVAYDSSGNANDGTVNGATWKSGCQQGACLEFDGVDDYVSRSDTSSLSVTSNITLSGWINLNNTSAGSPIVTKDTTTTNQSFYLNTANEKVRILVSSNGTTQIYRTGNTTLSLGTWYHVAGVYNSATGSLDVYLNGKLDNGPLAGTVPASIHDGDAEIRIGHDPRLNHFFNGQIDHVKIYNYARTPAQIAYDYNRGAPVAHWKFDECEGTVAHDASGNENHGTINIGASGTQTTAGTCSTSGAWANGASGKFEESLNFDGTDDYVDLGSSDTGSTLDLTERLTLSAWMKSAKSAGSTNYDIISRDNASTERQYNMHLTTSGVLRLYLEGTGVNGTSDLNDDKWHHIVATWDKSPGTINLYVDGKLEGSGSRTSSLTSRALPTFLGTRNMTGWFDGQIDDVRVYNYALSPAQIQKVHNQGYGVRYGVD